MRIIFLDIPDYPVDVPHQFNGLFQQRMKAEAQIVKDKFGYVPIRPKFNYSRGLLTIATSAKKMNHDVKYVVYSDNLDRKRATDLIKEADCIALSLMTPTVHIGQRICTLAKTINPKIKSIVGGPQINVAPEETLHVVECYDYAVADGCETLLSYYLESIERGEKLPRICSKNNATDHNLEDLLNHQISFQDMMPDYSLLYHSPDYYSHNIITQSGCPYKCEFCYESQSSPKGEKKRSIKSVIQEINYLSKFCKHGTMLHFSDSVFNLDRERTYQLCDEINVYKEKFCFSIDTRADLLDDESVEHMTRSGIKFFRFSFEDTDNEILSGMNKGFTKTVPIESANRIRKLSKSSYIYAYWITGLPGSTRESIAENSYAMRDLVLKGTVDKISNKIYVPYPGTPCYSNPEKFGMTIITKNWSKYDRFSFPVYRLDGASEHEIYFGFLFSEAIQSQAILEKTGIRAASKTSFMEKEQMSYLKFEKEKVVRQL